VNATAPRRLLVFARAPQPGRVKTRLIPALGAAGATAVYRQLLQRTLAHAAALPGIVTELWWDGAAAGAAPGRCAGLAERQQQGRDLGARMAHALEQALRRAPAAVLIGSDCPDCDADYLQAAFAALRDHDAVLGPALDGGYVLIGLKRHAPQLFSAMPWGTDRVLDQTRARLRALGWRWHELAVRRDVDRPEDLAHYPYLLAAAESA
jgi:rSAM/selenodomain-associated transferase 1